MTLVRADYFRRNAEVCFASIEKSDDPAERNRWLARALRWLELAREASDKAADEPLTPGTPRPVLAYEPEKPPPDAEALPYGGA